ncbi:hypothetical protein Rsub_02526 [Raphidocelis subcapitata]|uniref:Peptide transporter n=1 Tax=Raphidocelis subcapitata TaxID=307507 RepID=A0A2V0NT28_9CHLO|nr:hypothetical protein Rsub_02526 [Raphidocelis subcapitata]|eukprot:GBF89822.1 hypothetical protein Rsub_02526 [Raphidocelis subcapitata]
MPNPSPEEPSRAELESHFGVKDAGEEEPLIPHRKRRVASACVCILGNEICERLAYYGLQTNMGLYLKQYIGYPAEQASQLLQIWKATVYLTPLLGAFLADAYMGRFWVILVFSCFYLIGLVGVTAVNLIPSMRPRFNALPDNGSFGPTRSMLWAFLYLVALGSGGIKPCVSSFGGDQFNDGSKRERGWRSSFFNWFYFAINIGSLVATLVVVPVQENKGYGLGFGIPTIAMAASILLFIAGAVVKLYTIVPPEGSPFARIYRVLRGAFANRKLKLPAHHSELHEPAAGEKSAVKFRMPHTKRMPGLDRAAIKGVDEAKLVSVTEVEETKAFLYILPVFLCVCIWQMTYDPIFSLLPYPGDVMDRRMGNFKIPAASISFANTFGVLFTIPLYDMVIVPLAVRMGRPISMINRILIGYVVQLAALLAAGFIEFGRYRMLDRTGIAARWEAASATNPKATPYDPEFAQPMSIWWQFIPYFLLGASEVFTNVGILELFFTQVSEGMKALGASVYLLTVAVGTYMASALNLIVARIFHNDPWVADNPIEGHYDYYFFLNAVILFAGMLAFIGVTWGFEEKPLAPTTKDDPMDRGSRAHSDLANVTKAWPSVASRSSRTSELRARSSFASTKSMKRGEGGGKGPASTLEAIESQALAESQD